MSHDISNPPYELDKWPSKTEDEWLAEMAQWSREVLLDTVLNNDAPASARSAALQRRHALDPSLGPDASGRAFNRVVDRTLGRPREDPKVLVQQFKVLNVGTQHIFDNIEHILAHEPIDTPLRLESREGVEGSDHGPVDTEAQVREPDVPALTPQSSSGQQEGPD